ncbi:MAG: comEA [Acidimicrobiia bacterium]|nr:comEA [Acidimicrobiia bacterium]
MDSVMPRLRSSLGGRSPWQVLAAAVAVVALGFVGWWLLHAPAPPVESKLPRAQAAGPTTSGRKGASPSSTSSSSVDGGATSESGAATEVLVQVVGAVKTPGVYRLPSSARVTDAIAAAGGAVFGGDPTALRLAAHVADGQRIVVPRVGEPVVDDSASKSGAPTEPVDLNSATAEQLDALPGVGPSTAAAIVTYRNQHGRFASVDELADVHGIGPAKLEGLKGLVRV